MEDKEIYRIALDTRNFEINLFWQRSNYFLALNTALAVGVFGISQKWYALGLAVLGFIVCVLWCRVNLGSKYWQSRWEERLRIVEQNVAPQLDFFAANPATVKSDVVNSLATGEHSGLQNIMDKWVLKKPSVSFEMTRLSVVFVVAWFIVALMKLLEALCIVRL